MKIGDRVKVFDHLLFKNDIDTPLSITMVAGTIIKVYTDERGRDLIDVRQDRIRFVHEQGEESHISRGHFAWGVEKI